MSQEGLQGLGSHRQAPQKADRLLTSPSTHPAAPAKPSPRRRETSFSLPRRMDSRSLEKELLLRRTWG